MPETKELNSLLVRHIADLEGAMKHVKGVTDKIIWRELADLVNSQVDGDEWTVESNLENNEIRVIHRGWRSSEDDDPVAYLEFDERLESAESDETWLAEFLGLGPQKARLALYFVMASLTKKKSARRKWMAEQGDLVEELQTEGFVYDAADGYLYITVAVDQAKLATAFEEDLFDDAFEPVREAIATAIGCGSQLTKLVASAV